MRKVMITGVGQTNVGEQWDRSLRELGARALLDAMADAGVERVDAVVVGNMLSGPLCGQENLGSLLVETAGMPGTEAIKVEAACGSGGAAVRTGLTFVRSGVYDTVAVVGVEKMTDWLPDKVAGALALASDADFESLHGVTFVALNALLMRLYMDRYGYGRSDFAGFCINAHRNGASNPHAMFRRKISRDDFINSPVVSDPISLLDASPVCDGAAAVILQGADSKDYAQHRERKGSCSGGTCAPLRIAGSSLATDTTGLAGRSDPLFLSAAHLSGRRAMEEAGVAQGDVDLFEVHDAFSIMAVLGLEASGFAEPGQGVRLALDDQIGVRGRVPVATCGGLKSRGHPVGASGVYQVVEVVNQLRGAVAEGNQVPNARVGMAQSVGGSGSAVATHVIVRED